ncbi:MAG TPA: DUF305 domain-containing protein [Bryobacteraceae bacterium]|jgi:uncharacterized protein (DUF305 family)
MPFLIRIIGAILLSFVVCGAPAQQNDSSAPTIVQPGAPGQPGKILSPAEAAIHLRPPSQADVEFMQGMIVHHSQAVEMVALLRTRGSSKALQSLGNRISISQTDEIEYMKQWLRDRNQPIAAPGGHMMHHMGGMDMSKKPSGDVALMPGMLSPNQMKALAKARGTRFDYLFLTGMIQHHTGALDMVEDLFAIPGAGQDNVLFDFATDIDNTQRAEINIMKGMIPKTGYSKSSTKDKK